MKKFDSRGVSGKEGAERTGLILLKPLNPDYSPIELRDVAGDEVRVIAEVVQVLGLDRKCS